MAGPLNMRSSFIVCIGSSVPTTSNIPPHHHPKNTLLDIEITLVRGKADWSTQLHGPCQTIVYDAPRDCSLAWITQYMRRKFMREPIIIGDRATFTNVTRLIEFIRISSLWKWITILANVFA